jgi:hypothetical protein
MVLLSEIGEQLISRPSIIVTEGARSQNRVRVCLIEVYSIKPVLFLLCWKEVKCSRSRYNILISKNRIVSEITFWKRKSPHPHGRCAAR